MDESNHPLSLVTFEKKKNLIYEIKSGTDTVILDMNAASLLICLGNILAEINRHIFLLFIAKHLEINKSYCKGRLLC